MSDIIKQASGAMARFQCIGGACEDSCCNPGWSITYDRDRYEKLAARMSSPDEHAQLITSIRVRGVSDDPENYAQLVMRDDGKCSMLEPPGICTIHARYGEEYLSNICAAYPRFISKIGDRVELHGMTSCPEVVRLALLSEDGSGIAMGDAPDAAFGRGIPDREMEPTDDYRRSFLLVRTMMQSLLSLSSYPIASRLFFVSYFADQSREWLKDGADIDPQALTALMQSFRGVDLLDELAGEFNAVEVPVPFAVSVVCEILTRRTKQLAPALRVLIDEVRPLYADTPFDGSQTALFAAFEAKRPTLAPEVVARIDELVARFALDHVTRGWHVVRPSLIQYWMGILARVATIRFLLLSHPIVRADQPPDRAAIDALFVRIVYSLARTIDHDRRFAEELVGALERQGMTRIEHAICLIKL